MSSQTMPGVKLHTATCSCNCKLKCNACHQQTLKLSLQENSFDTRRELEVAGVSKNSVCVQGVCIYTKYHVYMHVYAQYSPRYFL